MNKQIFKKLLFFPIITTTVLISSLNAQAITLGGLIGRKMLVEVGASTLADKALDQIIDKITDVTFETDLTSELFETLNLGTVVISGAYTFYTDNGALQDFNFAVDVQLNSNEVDLTSNRKSMIEGTSNKGAFYSSIVDDAEAKTVNGLFDDQQFATVDQPILKTDNPMLTGEILFGGGFAFAFLGGSGSVDEFAFTPLSLSSIPLKKPSPVPEPSSILSLFVLGTIGAGSTLIRKKKQHK